MRMLKISALLFTVILSVSSVLQASSNKYGVSDERKVSFSAPMRVGDVLLPQGEYQVRHVMEGDNHMMVFTQIGANKPAEARVKCNLVPLKQKVSQNQMIYKINAADERVLQVLRFGGDTAEHVF